jgi:hypothetical protein
MSGGKGGSSTTSVQIPEWLESAARQNIARADRIAQIGYVPYYGPDVAAMTPMQLAAGGNINAAASAFGLGAPTSPMAGMQPAMDYGGMAAYSSAPLYEQSVAQLAANRPGQFAALQEPFINPITGAPPVAPFSANLAFADQTMAPVTTPVSSGGGEDNRPLYAAFGGNNNSPAFASSALAAALPGGVNDPFLTSAPSQAIAAATNPSYTAPPPGFRPVMRPDRDAPSVSGGGGGYTSIRDMFDGGGPGRSGDRFEGGGAISAVGNALGGPSGRDSDGGMGGGK